MTGSRASDANLIAALVSLQESRGSLHEADLRTLARQLGVPLSEIEAVSSFYPHLRRGDAPGAGPVRHVALCRDVSCQLAGAEACAERIEQRCGDRPDVVVERVSCIGRCEKAPALLLGEQPGIEGDVTRFLAGEPIPHVPTPVAALRIDPHPTSAEHYATLRRLVAERATADDIISRLDRSGLRGMGGAGFRTGTKWRLVASEEAAPRYVVCNADESEPGSFKDRALLEVAPHLVIEGLAIAARAVAAERGFVFLRAEYGPERRALERALEDARERGVLGERCCGGDRPLEIEIFVSPGGYILGEETALLEAMEGRRGEPRNKPPYPGVAGLYGKPTLINNIETLALVPRAIECGRADFKLFSVSGDVERPGVHEVSLGTTARELIALCGGMQGGRRLQAFVPGGPSTGFLPASMADRPLDWDSLREVGSSLGSGALIVVAEGRDLLALAASLTGFFARESCGKCVPCRIGSHKAVKMIEASVAGAPLDLALMARLDETLRATSLCGLGQVALAPLMSVARHFPARLAVATGQTST